VNSVIRIVLNDDVKQVTTDQFAYFIEVALQELGITAVVFVSKEEVEDGIQGEGS